MLNIGCRQKLIPLELGFQKKLLLLLRPLLPHSCTCAAIQQATSLRPCLHANTVGTYCSFNFPSPRHLPWIWGKLVLVGIFFHFLYHIFCLPSWSSPAPSDHWIPTPPFCTHAAQFTAATYQLGTVTGRSSGSFPKYVGYSPKVIYLKTLTHELCDLYKQKYFLREMTIPQFYFWDTKHEK